MQVGSRPQNKFLFKVGAVPVPVTPCFSYLGVMFDDRVNWAALIKRKVGEVSRANASIFGFASKMGQHPIAAMLKLYQAKSVAIARYGSEIWGYAPVNVLQVVENTFLKRLLSVPRGTSNYVVHEELGVPYLRDTLALCPLSFWLKCWLNVDLNLTQQILREIMSLDHKLRIP